MRLFVWARLSKSCHTIRRWDKLWLQKLLNCCARSVNTLHHCCTGTLTLKQPITLNNVRCPQTCPVVLQTYTVQDRQRFRVIFLFCFLGLKTMNETFKTEWDTGVKCHILQSLWSSHRLQQCKGFKFDFLKAFMILLEWFLVYLLPHCSSERLKEICLTCTFNLGSPVYQTSVCLDCGGKLEYLEDCR